MRRAAGFTLLEIMIVIVIMGLLLTLLLTRGPDRSPTLDLRAAASQVAQSLRLARTAAIATDRPVPFTIHPTNRALTGITITPPARPILFEPDGSATSGTIALGLNAMHINIAVHWLTGRVSIGPIVR